MSANAAPRALRSAILGSRLADFGAYDVEADCSSPGCPRDRRYRVADLARLFGKDMLMAAMIRRLRCRDCGERAERVVLIGPTDPFEVMFLSTPVGSPSNVQPLATAHEFKPDHEAETDPVVGAA